MGSQLQLVRRTAVGPLSAVVIVIMRVVILLPLLLLLYVALTSGLMRPRVGGMARFGRSGGEYGDDEDHGDVGDVDYDDYQEQLYKILLEKRIPPILRTGKRSISSLQGKRSWLL